MTKGKVMFGGGISLPVIKMVTEVVQSAAKSDSWWRAILDVTLGQIMVPLGLVLSLIGILWWLHEELQDATAAIRNESDVLKRDYERASDNLASKLESLMAFTGKAEAALARLAQKDAER